MKRKLVVLFLLTITCSSLDTFARQQVTFNVDIKPQLKDSLFVPGRDQLRLVGNIQPINTARPYFLSDEEPIDSVYSVTINFPQRFRNQTLIYNYEMTINYVKQTEDLERELMLRQGEVELPPLFFNAFVW